MASGEGVRGRWLQGLVPGWQGLAGQGVDDINVPQFVGDPGGDGHQIWEPGVALHQQPRCLLWPKDLRQAHGYHTSRHKHGTSSTGTSELILVKTNSTKNKVVSMRESLHERRIKLRHLCKWPQFSCNS